MSIPKEKLKELVLATAIKKLRGDLDDLKEKDKGDKGDTIVGPVGPQGLQGGDGKSIIGPKGEKGVSGKDGKDADPLRTAELASKIAQDALKPLIPTIPQIKEELPLTGEKIRDNLEDLKGKERLDKKAIRGLDDLEKKVDKNKNGGVRVIGGRAGIYLYVDGEKKGLVNTVNLIAGTGITLTYAREFGRNDITVSNDSVAGTVLVATGTVDGANADFTFTKKPSVIITDGVAYQETNKLGETIWTWTAGTLTATLTIPPQSDVYGLL